MDRAGAVVHLMHAFRERPPSVKASVEACGRYGDTAAREFPSRLPRAFTSYLNESLAQRPAGSEGKRGECRLAFAVEQEKTRLRHSFVTHPFHLTRPWYLDPALPGMAVVYVQTPAGGFIQGDRAALHFVLASEAQVHLTSQAAEKIHTMTANCALQQISFAIGPGAYAEYYPEPVILFPGARFGQEVKVELSEGASFFSAEIFLSHCSTNSVSFEAVATSLNVQEAGSLLLQERSFIQPTQQNLTGPGILGPYHVWGQALLIGPTVPAVWAQEIHALLATEPSVVCGTTLLPWGRGIGVKVVGADVRKVRGVLYAAWHALRTRHLGVAAFALPK